MLRNNFFYEILLISLIVSMSPVAQAVEYKTVYAYNILENIDDGDLYLENSRIIGKVNLGNKLGTFSGEQKGSFSSEVEANESLKVVDYNITIRNSIFEDDVEFSNTFFKKSISFEGTCFSGESDFSCSYFADNSSFQDVDFIGDTWFQSANFSGDANFWNASFKDSACFLNSSFRGYVDFGKVNFYGAVLMSDIDFGSNVNFQDAIFSNEVGFQNSCFKGTVNFVDVDFVDESSFFNTHFSRLTDFTRANFNKDVEFDDAKFQTLTYFLYSDFKDSVSFINSVFLGDTYFFNSVFSRDADFEKTNFSGDVFFYDANFAGKADFDDVHFGSNVYFNGTDFNNMEVKWSSLRDSLIFDELVYLRLVQNFRNQGQFEDADTAYYEYRKECQKRDSWLSLSKWGDIFMWLACGYGVKPFRAFGLGGGIVLLFSLLYWRGNGISQPKERYENTNQKTSFSDAFYFSMVTFATIGYGDWYPKDKFRKWVMIEGFLGWLTLGLFLVTLTNVMIRP